MIWRKSMDEEFGGGCSEQKPLAANSQPRAGGTSEFIGNSQVKDPGINIHIYFMGGPDISG
jgi:hypothetical protein